MSDMLVRLYDLPPFEPALARAAEKGVSVRRPFACERHIVLAWIRENFTRGWADECAAAFASMPVSCFIAVKGGELMGFACYDVTSRGFFGPVGTAEKARGSGLGKALLLRSLHALREQGYAYGIIGWAGPKEWFAKTVGAVEIAGSEPGFYKGLIK